MNSLHLLIRNCPPWAKIERALVSSLLLYATFDDLENGKCRKFHLILKLKENNRIHVSEVDDGSQILPKCCYERHIVSDGGFCLFKGAECVVNNDINADFWWTKLHQFLLRQNYAEIYKEWPLNGGMSHGNSSNFHIEMLDLIEKYNLDWEDEIQSAVLRKNDWLSKIFKVRKNPALNMRGPCPRCNNIIDKQNRICSSDYLFRKKYCKNVKLPKVFADCPNNYVVKKLVELERKRLKYEFKFNKKCVENGLKCCNTMKLCGLREIYLKQQF